MYECPKCNEQFEDVRLRESHFHTCSEEVSNPLVVNERLAVKAHWKKGRVVWGHVIQDYSSGSDWMKKHGGLTEGNFLFKPDNDGHSRIVALGDIIR